MVFARVRSPLPEWAIPLIYAVSALAAAMMVPRLEARLLPESSASVSAPVALALFSSIASGMIALTGIVFSLAFVMVQFSAMAYSPRLVLWVSRDPVLWHATGIFTATFLYAIGAIAWVDRNGSGRVPLVSGWLVIVLMLASVASFIALIQRLGMLQINRMLAFTDELGREVIEQMYPPVDMPSASVLPREEVKSAAVSQYLSYSGRPQALQGIDMPVLLSLATAIGAQVEVMVCVGDTLIEGMMLMRVFGGNRHIPDKIWLGAFEVGAGRTFAQDPKFALRLLVDIAIRALSPAVNDPTTAVQALDHIQDLLLRLGRRNLEIGARRDLQGVLRVAIPSPSWEDFLRLAFDEIRTCGASSVQVMRRMKALVGDLIAALPQERHPALERHRQRLKVVIDRSFVDEQEKQEASVEDRQGLGVAAGYHADGQVKVASDRP